METLTDIIDYDKHEAYIDNNQYHLQGEVIHNYISVLLLCTYETAYISYIDNFDVRRIKKVEPGFQIGDSDMKCFVTEYNKWEEI